jgi:hypothetical protein
MRTGEETVRRVALSSSATSAVAQHGRGELSEIGGEPDPHSLGQVQVRGAGLDGLGRNRRRRLGRRRQRSWRRLDGRR